MMQLQGLQRVTIWPIRRNDEPYMVYLHGLQGLITSRLRSEYLDVESFHVSGRQPQL